MLLLNEASTLQRAQTHLLEREVLLPSLPPLWKLPKLETFDEGFGSLPAESEKALCLPKLRELLLPPVMPRDELPLE